MAGVYVLSRGTVVSGGVSRGTVVFGVGSSRGTVVRPPTSDFFAFSSASVGFAFSGGVFMGQGCQSVR
jgi:hypothetical protein